MEIHLGTDVNSVKLDNEMTQIHCYTLLRKLATLFVFFAINPPTKAWELYVYMHQG